MKRRFISCRFIFYMINKYLFIYLKIYVSIPCGHVLKDIENQKCEKKTKIRICWIWVLNMYHNLFGTPQGQWDENWYRNTLI